MTLNPETAWARFGDEVRLQILADVLTFPNGINTQQWPQKKMRIDGWLGIPGAGHMLPEALFRDNILIIAPIFQGLSFEVTYPNREIHHWVRKLEIRPCTLSSYAVQHNAIQTNWLKRLAGGELGFQNVDLLRFVVAYGCDSHVETTYLIKEFVLELMKAGPMRFRAKKLEIVMDGACEPICEYEYCRCLYVKDLKDLITVHQDPLPSDDCA